MVGNGVFDDKHVLRHLYRTELPYGHSKILAAFFRVGGAPLRILKYHPATQDPLSFEKQTHTYFPHSSSLSSLPQSRP